MHTSSTLCRVSRRRGTGGIVHELIVATDYAITNRLTPFVSMQNFHNAAYREEEREMMPTLKVGHFLLQMIRI